MIIERRRSCSLRIPRGVVLLLAIASVLIPRMSSAQGLTGTLIGTIKDTSGGVVPGAIVRVSSPALMGGPRTVNTNEKGQWLFQTLPLGAYVLEVEAAGFAAHREEGLPIGAGTTIERIVELNLATFAASVIVEGVGSRIDARDPGFGTRFGQKDIEAIPTRRASMFDFIRAAPGVSPTSPASGSVTSFSTTFSVFGSGTNENQFLIDGTNFTCPCNGVARAEPGVDFIQEVHVQSIGASAEYGNVQGGVINVVTRQGGERFLSDAAYYAQTAGLTSQPIVLPYIGSGAATSGYERARFRDFTTDLGGPAVRDRLWFFAGYQHVRDSDSQPGTDPAKPRRYTQDKFFGKLTWRLTPNLRLEQSLHDESGFSPERPTTVTPFDAISTRHISVGATTFGHLTHTLSSNTVWDVRAGRFVYTQDDDSPVALTIPSRFDRVTGISSGGPARVGVVTIMRTTSKATLSHYRPDVVGADHLWKMGGQVELGEHDAITITPTGARFVDDNGRPFQRVETDPFHVGGRSITTSAFVSDAITVSDRLTISAGLRFDHARAISQDLPEVDAQGREAEAIVPGRGTMYTWNLWSPRLGVTMKLSGDGRTIMRGSYGRFSQGVLTGELEPFHPGATLTTTRAFVDTTQDYGRLVSVVDPMINLLPDDRTRAPHTDQLSLGIDREIGRRLALAIAVVHKTGGDFIGWTDVGGQYVETSQPSPAGGTLPVFRLTNLPANRRFLLTNQDGYSLTYNGLVIAAERRRAGGWQAFGSYTFSKTSGLQTSSGANAAGAQVSTVSPPNPSVFGRDPNDLTNAIGRLPNDRPHVFRVMGSLDVPRTGLVVAANLQHFSGKAWTASTLVAVPQTGNQPLQRILIEPRGSRRLSSQTLLDVRVSRAFTLGRTARIELLFDVLNALNDSAEESLANEIYGSPNFAQGVAFVDPRRAMLGVRLNLGR